MFWTKFNILYYFQKLLNLQKPVLIKITELWWENTGLCIAWFQNHCDGQLPISSQFALPPCSLDSLFFLFFSFIECLSTHFAPHGFKNWLHLVPAHLHFNSRITWPAVSAGCTYWPLWFIHVLFLFFICLVWLYAIGTLFAQLNRGANVIILLILSIRDLNNSLTMFWLNTFNVLFKIIYTVKKMQ